MRKIFSFSIFLLIACEIFSYSVVIDKEVFSERRSRLMEQTKDGIVVMMSGKVYKRNNDVSHEFRQGSHFFYLTGFEESSSAFILDQNAANKFMLFVQPKNPLMEVWTGKLCGVENAVKEFGADKSFPINSFDSVLNDYISRGVKIYFIKDDIDLAAKINNKTSSEDVKKMIGDMRLIKSEYEIQQLQKAIDITCMALIECMKQATPGMYEYELQATLEYNFKRNGCQRNGFPSIVGSGPNSCILHYETNNRQTHDGEMVVMDVGSEWKYYSADVTRTFPLNGKFSPEQREIYQIVYDAQEEVIKFLKPEKMFYQVDSVARSIVRERLIQIGLLKENEDVRKFFMHGTSHWLGLDVHDESDYTVGGKRGDRVLLPGTVLTNEPGIYIAEGTTGVDPRYYNIGVRIEDDIVITETGCEVMSKLAPRKIEDIEAVMRK